jgi:hypothetical protein
MFVPASLVDADEKDAFATTARLMCIAHAATVCFMALEAWMKTASPGEKLDTTQAPSEAFDRQEVIVLMGESHSGQKQKFLPIIRSGNGRFFNLGETTVPGMDKMKAASRKFSRRKWPTTKFGCLQKLCCKSIGSTSPNPVPPSGSRAPGADFLPQLFSGVDSRCPTRYDRLAA